MLQPLKNVRAYPEGSVIQEKTGYIKVKTKQGWISQGRLHYQQANGSLDRNQRVYHIDGDRTNNDAENLVAITFSEKRFQLLPHRRIMFMPKLKPAPSARPQLVGSR
jgi:hypothetical protein